jgi:hypothetical protein
MIACSAPATGAVSLENKKMSLAYYIISSQEVINKHIFLPFTDHPIYIYIYTIITVWLLLERANIETEY